MLLSRSVVEIDSRRCRECGFCKTVATCPSPAACIGCLSCYHACPYQARRTRVAVEVVKPIKIRIDGVEHTVPSGVSVAEALKMCGFMFSDPSSKKPSLACRSGGCWSCSLVIDGELQRTCVTPARNGMEIETGVDRFEPLRIVHGPQPHLVGGKATPWWEVNYTRYVEVAMWVAGCNLRCPQCQNYHVTYDSTSPALTPREAAIEAVYHCRRYGVKGVAISGGEPTINRRWLVEFFIEVSRRVESRIRRHLDSNGTILTPDYIDELVYAGCNNIGVEPKCTRVETYMKITGVGDRELAERYLTTAWRAVEYIYERYGDRVYLGVGLVYNKDLIELDEIAEAGRRIASIDRRVQVTVLDYFPAFRRRYLKRPTVGEMLEVKKVLEEQGLETVVVQTAAGHIGPGSRGAVQHLQ